MKKYHAQLCRYCSRVRYFDKNNKASKWKKNLPKKIEEQISHYIPQHCDNEECIKKHAEVLRQHYLN